MTALARDLNLGHSVLTSTTIALGLSPPSSKLIPMNPYRLNPIWLICLGLSISTISADATHAFQESADSILTRIESQLRPYTENERETLREKTLAACTHTIEELSKSAVGYALVIDKKLPMLDSLLRSHIQDPQVLSGFEEQLRFITPGPDQAYIDQLQVHLNAYRRVLTTDARAINDARAAIATLRAAKVGTISEPADSTRIRQAFFTLNSIAVDPVLLRALQISISTPNVQTQFRTSVVETHGKKSFNIPIQTSTCKARTNIETNGNVLVSLAPTFPQASQSIPLLMQVDSQGELTATARRPPVQIMVNLSASATGYQPIDLHPRSINRQSPALQVDIQSELQNVQLDGHLNRSRLIRNLLGRAIERELRGQEPLLSQKLEQEILKKAEDEGEKLAFKINRLLTQSLWARFESIRFAPEVSLASKADYLISQSLYAHPDQLGSLTTPPIVPVHLDKQLDWTTHTHESAINNVLSKISEFCLDEATVRGIWQVQLKLTTSQWETPQVASVPSTIQFAKQDPIRIEFRNHRLDVLLNMQSATLGSNQSVSTPRTTRISYSLETQDSGFRIVRTPLVFSQEIPPADINTWQQILTRFFPDALTPIPRFRPSMWENFVALRYLNSADGWLSVGLSDVSDEIQSRKSTHTAKGE